MDAATFATRQQEEHATGNAERGGPFFELVYNEQHEPAAQWFGSGMAHRRHIAAGLSAGPRAPVARARFRRRLDDRDDQPGQRHQEVTKVARAAHPVRLDS